MNFGRSPASNTASCRAVISCSLERTACASAARRSCSLHLSGDTGGSSLRTPQANQGVFLPDALAGKSVIPYAELALLGRKIPRLPVVELPHSAREISSTLGMPPEINQLPPRTVPARRTLSLHQRRLSGRLDRRAFHEMAWKNVVQCPPGMVTRIAVPFRGYAGRYVWHCHILRHQT